MSRILMISPDYASHYFPMSALGEVLGRRGHRVTVATGTGIMDRVIEDGFGFAHLVLGPGNNSGLLRPQDQSAPEKAQIEEFFRATREGMVPALVHQAKNRLNDLLFEPERVAADLHRLLSKHAPDVIVVDQLAFGATAALRGLGQDFVSFHPGHPSAISSGWPYGYPPRLPRRLRVSLEELEELKSICRQVVTRFTNEYNAAVASRNQSTPPVPDAFAATSELRTLINYPEALAVGYGLPAKARFLGSSVRSQRLPEGLALEGQGSRPRILISLGSFFSARSDLLRKLVAAFRHEPVNVVLASGTTSRRMLEPIPAHWTVESFLPQPAMLRRSDLVVTHGGNNTVTEALTAGIPLLVGPLSTDQFAGAADIERAGLGRAFDPNFDPASTIADLAHDLLASDAVDRAADLGRQLTASPGQELAADLIEGLLPAHVLA